MAENLCGVFQKNNTFYKPEVYNICFLPSKEEFQKFRAEQ